MKLIRIHYFYDGFPLYRIVGSIVMWNVEVLVEFQLFWQVIGPELMVKLF